VVVAPVLFFSLITALLSIKPIVFFPSQRFF